MHISAQRYLLLLAVAVAGFTALTWETIWLHHASLALGVSAQAMAVVVSTVMLGFAAGSLISGGTLKRFPQTSPLVFYAALECLIGFSGVTLAFGFQLVDRLDAHVFNLAPSLAYISRMLSTVVVLGIPSCCMGATVPLFTRIAPHFKLSAAQLYGWNAFGSIIGVYAITFYLIPEFGVLGCQHLLSFLNILVALAFLLLSRTTIRLTQAAPAQAQQLHSINTNAIVLVTCSGLVIFLLEVSWFRQFRSAFQATTESFALMLGPVLAGVAFSALAAPAFRRKYPDSLNVIPLIAGLLILLLSPLIERIDLLIPPSLFENYWQYTVLRGIVCFALLAPPIFISSLTLPWFLDQGLTSSSAARLYAFNTIACVLGSVSAAWILLPTIGAVNTSLFAGAVLIATSLLLKPRRQIVLHAVCALGALLIALLFRSGIGIKRVQTGFPIESYSLLASTETADNSVAVVEYNDKTRDLLIDGFTASGTDVSTHYMEWMGRLPMIVHSDPKRALVICFGTGQTAHAVHDEGTETLDIVDLSSAVFKMEQYFPQNQRILHEPNVSHHVMDGRLWLKRTPQQYDVITLEPMPPTFAGTNNLYSLEFYQLAKERLTPAGTIAQWLPFHLIDSFESRSIVRTFLEIFPSSILWIDPVSGTGILVGQKSSAGDGQESILFPGIERHKLSRSLSREAILQATISNKATLDRYAAGGMIISDDNQLLSYGYGRSRFAYQDMGAMNLKILRRLVEGAKP